jgi:hypothetical protein
VRVVAVPSRWSGCRTCQITCELITLRHLVCSAPPQKPLLTQTADSSVRRTPSNPKASKSDTPHTRRK